MCGIAGIVSNRVGGYRRSVETMLTAMVHRGPDDAGFVEVVPSMGDGTVVLGSRRLAILDCSSAGHMPMQDPSTENWITYNGESYNFQEIRATFGDTRWASSGDTEVLLRAYGRDGISTVSQWRGMFGVAIWDARRQQLVLARDRLGIKPLYYWQGDGLVVFASELRALLASGLIPRRLSREGVETFLRFGAVQDPVTLIDGVQALLPGHLAIVSSGQVTTTPYWDLPAPGTSEIPRAPAGLVDELCLRLEDSVVRHLVSDVPLGIFLSGGLDSSLIAAMAQRRSREPITTWTIAFQAPGANEGPQAAAIASAIGSRHREIVVDPRHLLAQLPSTLRAMDQPTIDGLNTYAVSKALREAGLTVALSGLGGDELFAGYPTFQQSLWCQQVPHWIRKPLSVVASVADGRRDRRERWSVLGDGDRRVAHPLMTLRAVYASGDLAAVLEQEPSVMQAGRGLFGGRLAHVLEASRAYDPVTQVSALELQLYMVNMLLRDTDAMSMAHSLEVRVPFLDHPLVEWALGIPGTLKLGASPKPLLAAALRRYVPDKLVATTKRGFVVPLSNWLRSDPQLRGQVQSVLWSEARMAQVGLVPGVTKMVWEQFLHGHRGWAQPWALFVLSQWVDTHLS